MGKPENLFAKVKNNHYYPIKVFYSEEDKGFIAIIFALPGCLAFGETEEDALREVKVAQELWIETARKEGRKIPRPSSENIYSGKILARTPKSLHKALMEKAKQEGVSLNQLVVYILSRVLEKRANPMKP